MTLITSTETSMNFYLSDTDGCQKHKAVYAPHNYGLSITDSLTSQTDATRHHEDVIKTMLSLQKSSFIQISVFDHHYHR